MKKEYLKLLSEAKKAVRNAYCPYSKFKVGAAVLTDKGIFTGVNVENASYGLSCCAERVAVFKAISAGAKSIKAVALESSGKEPVMPCGACRQVLSEFGRNIDVVTGKNNIARSVKLSKLLPKSFGAEDLK